MLTKEDSGHIQDSYLYSVVPTPTCLLWFHLLFTRNGSCPLPSSSMNSWNSLCISRTSHFTSFGRLCNRTGDKGVWIFLSIIGGWIFQGRSVVFSSTWSTIWFGFFSVFSSRSSAAFQPYSRHGRGFVDVLSYPRIRREFDRSRPREGAERNGIILWKIQCVWDIVSCGVRPRHRTERDGTGERREFRHRRAERLPEVLPLVADRPEDHLTGGKMIVHCFLGL